MFIALAFTAFVCAQVASVERGAVTEAACAQANAVEASAMSTSGAIRRRAIKRWDKWIFQGGRMGTGVMVISGRIQVEKDLTIAAIGRRAVTAVRQADGSYPLLAISLRTFTNGG